MLNCGLKLKRTGIPLAFGGLSVVAVALLWVGSSQAQPAATQATAKFGTNRVSITVSGGERVINANGIPDHKPGEFPRRGNPNSISAQSYNLKVPSNPKGLPQPVSAGHALFGVAVNGVPFDPATAEFWNNDRSSGWNYEANTGFLNLGLDEHNAHVQPTGAYHYHGLPKGLIARLERTSTTNVAKMVLLGWAADGFPIYTQLGHASAMDAASPLKKLHSSYRVKKGTRSGGPGGSYDGRFTADFEYVKGSGELDECNGRFGVTPRTRKASTTTTSPKSFHLSRATGKARQTRALCTAGPGLAAQADDEDLVAGAAVGLAANRAARLAPGASRLAMAETRRF